MFAYYTIQLELSWDSLFLLLYAAHVGDSLVMDWVIRSYVIIVLEFDTYTNLTMENIMDFDVILSSLSCGLGFLYQGL